MFAKFRFITDLICFKRISRREGFFSRCDNNGWGCGRSSYCRCRCSRCGWNSCRRWLDRAFAAPIKTEYLKVLVRFKHNLSPSVISGSRSPLPLYSSTDLHSFFFPSCHSFIPLRLSIPSHFQISYVRNKYQFLSSNQPIVNVAARLLWDIFIKSLSSQSRPKLPRRMYAKYIGKYLNQFTCIKLTTYTLRIFVLYNTK